MANKITPQMIEKYKSLEKELKEFYDLRNEEIVTSYNSGSWSYIELANKYGLTRQRVYKIIKQEAK